MVKTGVGEFWWDVGVVGDYAGYGVMAREKYNASRSTEP